jgi:hypothetical protein
VLFIYRFLSSNGLELRLPEARYVCFCDASYPLHTSTCSTDSLTLLISNFAYITFAIWMCVNSGAMCEMSR